jgi:hypothetical protein
VIILEFVPGGDAAPLLPGDPDLAVDDGEDTLRVLVGVVLQVRVESVQVRAVELEDRRPGLDLGQILREVGDLLGPPGGRGGEGREQQDRSGEDRWGVGGKRSGLLAMDVGAEVPAEGLDPIQQERTGAGDRQEHPLIPLDPIRGGHAEAIGPDAEPDDELDRQVPLGRVPEEGEDARPVLGLRHGSGADQG